MEKRRERAMELQERTQCLAEMTQHKGNHIGCYGVSHEGNPQSDPIEEKAREIAGMK